MTFATSKPGPNLGRRSVDSSLDDTLGSTLLWNWPSHLNDFLLNPWPRHVQHVVLQPLLRSEYREFDRIFHCSRHRDTDVLFHETHLNSMLSHLRCLLLDFTMVRGTGMASFCSTLCWLAPGATLTTSSVGSSVHETGTSVICPQFFSDTTFAVMRPAHPPGDETSLFR